MNEPESRTAAQKDTQSCCVATATALPANSSPRVPSQSASPASGCAVRTSSPVTSPAPLASLIFSATPEPRASSDVAEVMRDASGANEMTVEPVRTAQVEVGEVDWDNTLGLEFAASAATLATGHGLATACTAVLDSVSFDNTPPPITAPPFCASPRATAVITSTGASERPRETCLSS